MKNLANKKRDDTDGKIPFNILKANVSLKHLQI